MVCCMFRRHGGDSHSHVNLKCDVNLLPLKTLYHLRLCSDLHTVTHVFWASRWQHSWTAIQPHVSDKTRQQVKHTNAPGRELAIEPRAQMTNCARSRGPNEPPTRIRTKHTNVPGRELSVEPRAQMTKRPGWAQTCSREHQSIPRNLWGVPLRLLS